MTLLIKSPGIASTVQDLGRPGYYHLGIPISGSLDLYSHRLANRLVGNDEAEAVIEATLIAPEIEIQTATYFAVTGADLEVSISGKKVAANTCHAVEAGDTLKFGFMKLGARVYIAFAGGIDVPIILGSRSTYALGVFGGFQGRKLAEGDVVPVGKPKRPPPAGQTVPEAFHAQMTKSATVRVVPGLHIHRVEESTRGYFYEDTWTVGQEADRIGFRFKNGRPIEFIKGHQPFGAGSDPSNIVDAGYPYGSIQVPGGQEPIILHRDAVSGGGYAMIGTVIAPDFDILAQLQPGYKARFVAVDVPTALEARKAAKARLESLRSVLPLS